MTTKTMKLSGKNANWIMPKTIDVMKLLKDKSNKELRNDIFAIIVQPIDGRRTVIVLTRKDAGKLSYNLMKMLASKKEKI